MDVNVNVDVTGAARETRKTPAAMRRMEKQVGDVRRSGQVCLPADCFSCVWSLTHQLSRVMSPLTQPLCTHAAQRNAV